MIATYDSYLISRLESFHSGFYSGSSGSSAGNQRIVNNYEILAGTDIAVMSQPQVQISNAAVQLIHDTELLALSTFV